MDARVSPPESPGSPEPPESHPYRFYVECFFALVSFDFVCLLWCCFSTPLGRAVLWEVRCMPRRLCVGAQGVVAYGNGQRWGGEFPLEVPPGVPQGFDRRFPQRSPQKFPQRSPGAPPAGFQGCSPGGWPRVPPGFPSGFLTLGGVCSRRPHFYTCCCHACLCQGPGENSDVEVEGCIAVAGRFLQAGRSQTSPWEAPRVDARASPPGRPPGWTPASPPP